MSQIWLKYEPKRALKLRNYHQYDVNQKGSGGNNNSNVDEVEVGKIFLPFPRIGIKQIHSRFQGINRVSFFQDFFRKLNDINVNNLYKENS